MDSTTKGQDRIEGGEEGDNLRSEYRRRIMEALTQIDNNAEDQEALEGLMETLIDLEDWLRDVFGGEGKVFSREMEDVVAVVWKGAEMGEAISDILNKAEKAYDVLEENPLGKMVLVDEVILDPKGKLVFITSGERAFIGPVFQDRVSQFISAVQGEGLYLEDIQMFKGVVGERMRRKRSYVVFEIPKLNKQVLVNDQVGEGTFVVNGIVDRRVLFVNNKDELKAKLGNRVRMIPYRNREQWERDVMDFLFRDEAKMIVGGGDEVGGVDMEQYLPMNAKYFTDENIRHDLQAYADDLGLEGIESLNTENLFSVKIKCVNGEEVSGRTYLSRAGIVFGLASSSRDVQRGKYLEILNLLKKKSGIEVKKYLPMNAEYFTDENIRHDLQAYADDLELEGIESLSTHNIAAGEIICANGEKVVGSTYLSRAGFALGFGVNRREAHGKPALILDFLKKKCGIEVKKYPLMDVKYFTGENIRHDLQACVDELELEGIASLTTRSMGLINRERMIRCANGEDVIGPTYLNRAGLAFGLSTNARDAQHGKYAAILELLKKKCGIEVKKYPPMDVKYFTGGNIRHDLQAYVDELKLEGIKNLTTNKNMQLVKIRCANGEEVAGQTYLNRAGIAFGMAKTTREVQRGKRLDVLNELKRRVAVVADIVGVSLPKGGVGTEEKLA
ncbi:MAG: hypothetical protein WCX95_00540 [Candidatus Gracilibacteria bacterium]